MTSRHQLGVWFDYGVRQDFTHMIVVCDDFDYEDYPVYVSEGENAGDLVREYNTKDMQRVMEVYDLNMDKATQMDEYRAFHY